MSQSYWLAAALLLCGAPGALAQRVTLVGAPPLAFAFSEVTSRPHADDLVDAGSLMKIYLFPTQLGGDDDPRNIAYVTPAAAEKHALIAGKLRRMFQGAGTMELEVLPEYRGDSIVPARIRFKASPARGGKPFEEVVEVW